MRDDGHSRVRPRAGRTRIQRLRKRGCSARLLLAPGAADPRRRLRSSHFPPDALKTLATGLQRTHRSSKSSSSGASSFFLVPVVTLRIAAVASASASSAGEEDIWPAC